MAEELVEGAAFAVDASPIAADANKQRSAAGSDDVDWEAIARTRRSVREYLDTLDEAAWGAASETVPKFISKSDPAAQWTWPPTVPTAQLRCRDGSLTVIPHAHAITDRVLPTLNFLAPVRRRSLPNRSRREAVQE
jgi:hypothetical protein